MQIIDIFEAVREKAGSRARLRLVESDGVQAWTDGVDVFVTTGLLAKNDEHEIAGILAHELAHIALAHVSKEQAALDQVHTALSDAHQGGGIVESVVAAGIKGIAIAAIRRGRSRANEHDADRRGQAYASGAGYADDGLARALANIAAEHNVSSVWDSHPTTPQRQAALANRSRRTVVIRIRKSHR